MPRNCTITGNNKEFVIIRNFVNNHIRESSDYLLFWRKVGSPLVLEIPDCSRQCKVAINSPRADIPTSGTYSGLLS